MSTNTLGQLLCREQAIRFHNGPLRMDPFGLNGVEPGVLGGQETRQDANAFPRLFDLLMVLPDPIPNHFAHMPGSVIEDLRAFSGSHPVSLVDLPLCQSQYTWWERRV